MRVLVFGDSVVDGRWDSQGGWVDRLKRDYNRLYLEKKDRKHEIMNLGVGGDDSSKLLKRLEPEINARYSASWPFVFVIAIGTNDSRLVDNLETPQVSEDEFRDNLQKIIEVCKRHGDKILFVSPNSVVEDQTKFKNLYFLVERIKKYDAIISEVAEKNHISKADVLSEFESRDKSKLFFEDDLHPNDAGHELIYSLVKPELDKLLASEG